MRKVIGLFPTPFMICERVLDDELVRLLIAELESTERETNARTDTLSHTEMVDPSSDSRYAAVVEAVQPELVRFGRLLFGDDLEWSVKEMWMNILEHGGSQFMHTHANSFVSGIVYLSEHHPSSRTVFMRNAGGAGEFIFKHDVPDDAVDEFNADRWVVPAVSPGDLVLYPSYLLHGVPPNEGGRRMTLALNAIPDHLKSYGYRISFAG